MYHYVHISLKVACVVKIETENLKTLTSFNYPKVQYFLLKLRAHVSYLPMSTKGCVRYFYFVYILSYLQKFKKTWFLHTRFLHFYQQRKI